jgi:acid phosphatase class B
MCLLLKQRNLSHKLECIEESTDAYAVPKCIRDSLRGRLHVRFGCAVWICVYRTHSTVKRTSKLHIQNASVYNRPLTLFASSDKLATETLVSDSVQGNAYQNNAHNYNGIIDT